MTGLDVPVKGSVTGEYARQIVDDRRACFVAVAIEERGDGGDFACG